MIRMSDNVLAFSTKTGTTQLFELFSDMWNHYLNKYEKKSTVYDQNFSYDDKSAKMNEMLKKEIAKIAGVQDFSIVAPEMWVTNPMYKWATFSVISALIDMILPDTIIDSIGAYTDIRTGGFGDNFAFDLEPNDLFYVTKSGRGVRHAEAQKSFNGQVIVTPVEHDISVSVNLYRVLAGKEDLAKFAMKCIRSMETEMAYDAYSAFHTAMLAVPATADKELYYSGFSEANAVELTDKVTEYNNGAKAIFMGTRKAVYAVLPTHTDLRIQVDSDYVKLGYIKEFFGTDIVVMPQKANWKDPYASLLSDDYLYVLSPSAQKIVKLAIEGSTLAITDDPLANANLTQQTTLKKMWATGIATNATFGVIKVR